MKVKDAVKITGSMTRTSKMPGLSYSLPAWECQVGAKLRAVKGSVCSGCYALKGNYTRYPAIKAAQYYRLQSLRDPRWIPAMVAQIKRQKFFRWHDSGDVQDLEHLFKIYKVCAATPTVEHWMPTRCSLLWLRHASTIAYFLFFGQRNSASDIVCYFFRQHYCGCIQVPADNRRHYRSVDNTKFFQTMHLTF